MKSKFKIWAYLAALLAIVVSMYAAFVITVALEEPDFSLVLFYMGLLLLVFLVWLWIWFGELRTKAVAVHFEGEDVVACGYFGIGISKRFKLKDFEGCTLSLLSSKYGDYEYLYFMINNKKIIKLSEFYHSNYWEMKQFLESKMQFLGTIPFSISDEFKEIFQNQEPPSKTHS